MSETDSSTKPELLPCPFCGNDDIRIMSAWAISEQSPNDYAAHCSLLIDGCGATGRFSRERLVVVTSWNRRA